MPLGWCLLELNERHEMAHETWGLSELTYTKGLTLQSTTRVGSVRGNKQQRYSWVIPATDGTDHEPSDGRRPIKGTAKCLQVGYLQGVRAQDQVD